MATDGANPGLIPYLKIGWSILYNWPELGEHLQRRFRVAPKAAAVVRTPKGDKCT